MYLRPNIKSNFINENVSICHPCVVDSSRWASGCSEEWGCHDFDVLVLRPWPLTSTEGHLWHAMQRVHGVGQTGVKLSPPQLYRLREFREGTLTRLSHRVQSLICIRQGLLPPLTLPLWTLKIRAPGIAAEEYKVVEFKWSSCKKIIYKATGGIILQLPRGLRKTVEWLNQFDKIYYNLILKMYPHVEL